MTDQRRQVLQMLADGKINTDEAERLLAALDGTYATAPDNSGCCAESGKKPKFLHIKVQADPGSHHGHENVDIKIPLIIVKAGIKLGTLIPEKARNKLNSHLGEKGLNLDLNHLDAESVDTIIKALTESSIDVQSDRESVRIYCC